MRARKPDPPRTSAKQARCAPLVGRSSSLGGAVEVRPRLGWGSRCGVAVAVAQVAGLVAKSGVMAKEELTQRIEVSRKIAAPCAAIFSLLCDPQGHVAIDSSGMLQSADGEPAAAVGDTFVVHMDRESLNDYPELGRYDVTVKFTVFEPDREIAWTILSVMDPPLGHVYGYRLEPTDDGGTEATSYCDWSGAHQVWRDAGIFPILGDGALRATLGILARQVTTQR